MGLTEAQERFRASVAAAVEEFLAAQTSSDGGSDFGPIGEPFVAPEPEIDEVTDPENPAGLKVVYCTSFDQHGPHDWVAEGDLKFCPGIPF